MFQQLIRKCYIKGLMRAVVNNRWILTYEQHKCKILKSLLISVF